MGPPSPQPSPLMDEHHHQHSTLWDRESLQGPTGGASAAFACSQHLTTVGTCYRAGGSKHDGSDCVTASPSWDPSWRQYMSAMRMAASRYWGQEHLASASLKAITISLWQLC
eukprot:888325-Pelagomonas_calceolata.AAC.7